MLRQSLKERKGETKSKSVTFHLLFHCLQMAAVAGPGPCGNQETGTPSESSTLVVVTQKLGPFSAAFPEH